IMRDSIALGTKAFTENTEVARASGERYQTTANQLKTLQNQLTDVAITLGDALVPTLVDAVHSAKPLIDWAESAAHWFKELPEPVGETTLVVGGRAAAAGPTVYVLGSVAGAAGTLIRSWQGVSAALAGAELFTATTTAMTSLGTGIGAVTVAADGAAVAVTG